MVRDSFQMGGYRGAASYVECGVAFFEPLLAAVRQPNGRKPVDRCRVLDGVFCIARTGAPWRDLPEEFGKWGSVYRQFRRWTLAGLWQTILGVLNESEAVPDSMHMIDSTVIRAHHQAAGAKGGSKGGSWRFKRGFRSRIHRLVNSRGLPMKVVLTPGQTSDYLGHDAVMDNDLPLPKGLLADKGYAFRCAP